MTLLCNFMQRPFCVVEEALYKKYAFLLLFFPLVEISYADRLKNRDPSHMTGKYSLHFLLSTYLPTDLSF